MSDTLTYLRGQSVRLACAFANAAGAAVDPTTVRFQHRTPAGVVTTWQYPTDAQLQRTALGQFYVDLTLATAGAWYWRWEGSGSIAAASEGSIVANEGHF